MVPVAFEFDGSSFWVGVSGASVLETRWMRNIRSGRDRVALVIDDLVSFDAFIVRGVRIYGVAAPPVERIGMVGPGVFTEIMPTIPWSWNMGGSRRETPGTRPAGPSTRPVEGTAGGFRGVVPP